MSVTELAKRATGRNGSDADDLSPEDAAAIDRANASADSDDLGEQGGRTIEDLTPEDEEGQTLLDLGGNLNLSLKGKKPTDSEVKVKAVSTPVLGQLGDKGDD